MSIIYKPLRLRAGVRNIQLASAAKKKAEAPAAPAKPVAKAKPKVADESSHLQVVKKRQALLKKKGLCICCGKRKSNVKRGSTKLRCAVCSEVARVYGRNRYAQLKNS